MNSTSSGTFRRLDPGLEASPGRNRRPVRHGWSGWTQLHFRWLEEQKFAHAVQQVVFQEYVDAVMEVRNRVASLEARMRQALEGWSLRPVVEALMALRGVDPVVAMTVLSALGDLTRFDSPRQLMGLVGPMPSEHSSGARRRQRGGSPRPAMVACAGCWSKRPGATVSPHARPRTESQGERGPAGSPAIGWAAQRALVRPIPGSVSLRQGEGSSHDRGGPRAGGVHLGGRLRGDGSAPCDAGACTR